MDIEDDKLAMNVAVGPSYLGHDLIFIISQPKAGSTLLQRLLAGHTDIQTSAETWLMLHPVYGLRSHGIKTDYNANWAATGVREFLDNYLDGEETYREGLRSFAKTIYGRALQKYNKKLFLDKTPRYTMIIDELYELFPEAKYVLLLRNPLAVLKSELHTYVKGDWPILSDFAPDLLDAPARIVSARDTLGSSGFEIKYEDLVTNPEEKIRDLCHFLDINFDPVILDYSNTPAPTGKMNDPIGIHRHTKASTSSLEKWKELGQDGQLRSFATSYLDALGDEVIAGLGYDPIELRAEVERQSIVSSARHVYPWKLAITPKKHWSLRQHIAHAYFSAAQRRGVFGGIIQASMTLFARISGGATRLASRADRMHSPTGQDGTRAEQDGSAQK